MKLAFDKGHFDDYKEAARKKGKLWEAPTTIRPEFASPVLFNVKVKKT